MGKYSVDDLKKMIPGVSEEKFLVVISKGVLKLNDEEINTITFVFFLCLLAELNMGAVLTEPWKQIENISSFEKVKEAKKLLNEFITDKKFTEPPLDEVLKGLPNEIASKIRAVVIDRYRDKSILDMDNLNTFGDKILAYQAIKSKNNVTKILWILKGMRDDISHGRIMELKYEGQLLVNRKVKEKLLIDYMEAFSNPDHTKSNLSSHLQFTEEEHREIQRLLGML
ncbi:hypothetical protein KGO95_00130 [Patescibacteria group bacterium]|nr:hypothetical protein [Patescibacteria group bacterium]